MVALQTFARLGGRVRRGREFTTNESHAAHLEANGIAERIGGVGPAETQATGPTETQAPLPPEVTPVGGGWFEWNGTRYRGRKAAEAARDLEG